MWIDDPFPIKSVHFPNTVDQDPGPIPAMLDNPAGAVKANVLADGGFFYWLQSGLG